VKLALVVLLALGACSNGKQSEDKRLPERPRRVIDPPPRGVRALPPHAIRAEGVGPYRLGATVTALLDQLPSGPRITQFALPNVIQRDILRAEDDGILIGAEPQGKATFVSVVRPDIARTEAGVHVGSTRTELETALGAPFEAPERAHDPRVVIPTGLKNARFIIEDERIAAIVVVAEPERPKDGKEAKDAKSSNEVVRYSGDDLALVSRDTEKLIAGKRVPGLVYAATLRNPNDGRDDIVAIVKASDQQARTWSLSVFRVSHEGKLVAQGEPAVLYTISAANARWIGADIEDLDLYLELTSRADSIEVGGLLTTRTGAKIRDIVVISSPVSVLRKRAAKPIAHETLDAGNSQ
jgi:hypothetical protein